MKKNILFVLLPFWTPLIPPLGIAGLKSYLQQHGNRVKTVDANVDKDLREFYHRYFQTLRQYVPEDKKGNFYSIGHDVLRNHMMAYINHNPHDHHEKHQYQELVNLVLYKNFYIEVPADLVQQLHQVVGAFYTALEAYFLQLLGKEKPGVLGLSVYSGTLPASIFAAKLARDKYPHMQIIMGGGVFADQLAQGTPNLDYFLQQTRPYIDKIIIGEGEVLLHKLLKGELPGNKRVYTLADIQWEIMDMSSAPPADFSDFHLNAYPHLPAYTSRSCPYQCSFCSETIQWGKYRKKKPGQIVRELALMNEKYGSRTFFMSDSLMNPVITDLAREMIKTGKSLYWDGCIRADQAAGDTRNTLLWRHGGFYRARLGLESGSQRMLKLMGKKITVDIIKKALTSLARAGIKTSTLWVVGHPGETEEDFRQTLDLIETYKDYIYDAEGTPFWYHISGQAKSGEWPGQSKGESKNVLLYPREAKKMLLTQTWILDCQPGREEIYRRQNRFVRHVEKLGIPNPYSLQDIHRADERWKKLHKNAVPSLTELKSENLSIDDHEARNVKEIKPAQTWQHDGEWGF